MSLICRHVGVYPVGGLLAALTLPVWSQVTQARYMSNSIMLTFVLLCNWSDLHIYKDLYGKRNKVQKYENLLLNYEYIRS